MDNITTFGALIRKLRDAGMMTQRELAKKLGVSHAAVNFWENGERRPSRRVMRRLIVVFGKHEAKLRAAYFAYPEEGKE